MALVFGPLIMFPYDSNLVKWGLIYNFKSTLLIVKNNNKYINILTKNII